MNCCTRVLQRAGVAMAIAGLAPLAAQRTVVVAPDTSWSVRSWDTSSGLSQNSVNEVLHAQDGALWAATFGGLCRYDGRDWRVFDAPSTAAMKDSRVGALAEDTDGSIWFVGERGEVIRYDGVGFARVATVGENPRHMTRLPDGRMAVGSDLNVFVVGRDGAVAALADAPLPRTEALLALPDGDLLACGAEGVTRIGRGGRTSLFAGMVTTATLGPDGTAWFGTNQGVLRLRGGAVVAASEELSPAAAKPTARLLATRSGALWCGNVSELICYHPGSGVAPVRFALLAAPACLHEDAAGGIWVGMLGFGLARIAACEARGIELPAPDGRLLAGICVLPDGEDSFVVGTTQGLHTVTGGRVTARVLRDAVTQKPVTVAVHALHRDTGGRLWLGLEDGVATLEGETFTRVGKPIPGLVRAIARDARNQLLVGSQGGLLVLDEGPTAAERAWRPYEPVADVPAGPIKLLVPWTDGGLWVVGDKSVARLDPAGVVVESYQRDRDLRASDVRAVLAAPGGGVWFATYGSGFVPLGQPERAIGPAQGLPDAFLCSATPFGGRWLVGGNRGPFLIDPAELDRVAATGGRVRCSRLTCTTNIPAEANGGVMPSIVAQHGVAALCGVGGLWTIRADRLRRDHPRPVCQVQPLLGGDQRLEPSAAGRRVRMRDDRTLVAMCTVPEFGTRDGATVRWRFGDAPWSAPMPPQSVSIALPGPGEFVLEFAAIDGDGIESAAPTRLLAVVEAQSWERPWFAWLCLAAVAVAGLAVFRFGSHRSARQAARLRQLVDERTVELIQARDQLEQRVADRTAELQRALEQLEVDHAQRTRLERQLEQMRRMESLGQLAGSVAHDFNNLLTVVLGNAQLLEFELPPGADARELAQRILEAAARGREMTQRLLAVASRQTVVPQVLDLGSVLRDQLGVLGDLMGDAVRVELRVDDEPLRILAAPGQVDQIVMNLAINARQAMPAGGRFVLHARRHEDTVHLDVRDEGVGMTPEVARRAFEPFFTTRAKDGTGLGLATVYGITKQLQGDVTIDSAPGSGTTFHFVFPRAQQDPAAKPAAPSPAGPATGAALRVLLIEDEHQVRIAIRMLLQACGCVVVGEADCGDEAVRFLERTTRAIDVVVSDVRMPGLQGVELVRALRALRPGLPLVFVSGHTSSTSLLAELGPMGIELIAKPPSREELLPALERAVQRARPAGPA